MKRLLILAALAFSACGGNGSTLPPMLPLPAAQPPIEGNIVWYGDDVTWRWCQPEYTAPWTTVQLTTPVTGQCAAVQGETSDQTYARLPYVIAMRADFVVIETGLNDIRRGEQPDLAALVAMVQAFQARGTHVVLGTLPPSAGLLPGIQAWNAQVRATAKSYGTPLADYYFGITDPQAQPEAVTFDSALFTTPLMDGEFPTPNGYEIMWDVACAIAGLGGPQS